MPVRWKIFAICTRLLSMCDFRTKMTESRLPGIFLAASNSDFTPRQRPVVLRHLHSVLVSVPDLSLLHPWHCVALPGFSTDFPKPSSGKMLACWGGEKLRRERSQPILLPPVCLPLDHTVLPDVFASLERDELDACQLVSRLWRQVIDTRERLLPLRRIELVYMVGTTTGWARKKWNLYRGTHGENSIFFWPTL